MQINYLTRPGFVGEYSNTIGCLLSNFIGGIFKVTKYGKVVILAESGVLSIVVISIATYENFIPLYFSYHRTKMMVELQDKASPGARFACDSSGRM